MKLKEKSNWKRGVFSIARLKLKSLFVAILIQAKQ